MLIDQKWSKMSLCSANCFALQIHDAQHVSVVSIGDHDSQLNVLHNDVHWKKNVIRLPATTSHLQHQSCVQRVLNGKSMHIRQHAIRFNWKCFDEKKENIAAFLLERKVDWICFYQTKQSRRCPSKKNQEAKITNLKWATKKQEKTYGRCNDSQRTEDCTALKAAGLLSCL